MFLNDLSLYLHFSFTTREEQRTTKDKLVTEERSHGFKILRHLMSHCLNKSETTTFKHLQCVF